MKTGLNFYTTTIINSAKYNGTDHFKADASKLEIRPGMTFKKDNIQKVYFKAGYEGKMAKTSIDLATLNPSKKTYYRLDVYVKVQGAEPYIYATPWIQKGRPFWVEFSLSSKGDASAASVLAKAIEKEHIFQVGDNQIEASASGTKVVLTATADYLRFANVQVVTLNDEGDDEEVVTVDGLITHDVKGENAFGSYSQIIKDVQLPTVENTHWMHLRQDETPVVGAIYDQFIIEYADSANNRPLGAVGCDVTSHTTHTFWVKNDISTDFKNLFNKSGLNLEVTTVTDGKTDSSAIPTSSDASEQKAVNSQLNTKSGK